LVSGRIPGEHKARENFACGLHWNRNWASDAAEYLQVRIAGSDLMNSKSQHENLVRAENRHDQYKPDEHIGGNIVGAVLTNAADEKDSREETYGSRPEEKDQRQQRQPASS
jgi:hypothetical protein